MDQLESDSVRSILNHEMKWQCYMIKQEGKHKKFVSPLEKYQKVLRTKSTTMLAIC